MCMDMCSDLSDRHPTPPAKNPYKSEREKREREREKKKNGAGGGVLQGKGPFPSSVWDPWWNRAAQGAGLLKNRSKVKKLTTSKRFRLDLGGRQSYYLGEQTREGKAHPRTKFRQLEMGLQFWLLPRQRSIMSH